MANPNTNQIDTTISAADQTSINTGFTLINTALDNCAQQLTQDQRESLHGIAVENEVFSDDALEQAQVLFGQFPPTLQTVVTNMVNDTTLNGQLDTITNTQILPLFQRVKDTKRLVAHERYTAAVAIYKYIETGAALGLPGFQAAYDILKARFTRHGGGRPLDV